MYDLGEASCITRKRRPIRVTCVTEPRAWNISPPNMRPMVTSTPSGVPQVTYVTYDLTPRAQVSTTSRRASG